MSETRTVTVDLGSRSYPIHIGAETLPVLGSELSTLVGATRAVVVTNSTIGDLYQETVLASLRTAGFEAQVVHVPDGEEYKVLDSVAFLYGRFLEARLDRGSLVIALGGGVIGDLAGFAAATFLRGVPLVQVPTTLLAQVDASIGGKTGVNLEQGKNLVGAFYQPCLVWQDVCTLRSLPEREFRAGIAEVIKYGIIMSPELFELIEHRMPELLAADEELLVEIVQRCCALKAAVVVEDERESGRRAILNFGHTVGHAVERLTGYRDVLHGEAVAIGMVFAARLSRVRGHCSVAVVERIIELVRRAGLPIEVPEALRGRELALAMGTDKKMTRDRIRFVCVRQIGSTCFELLGEEDVLRQAA